ncbi:MAG: hypothetical protein NC127_05700 [Muribaculum sp.]|nr:hypothetical protein [Muribaculum sp.]
MIKCYAIDKTFILMQTDNNLSSQRWFYGGAGSELPESKIKEEWDKDKYITGAAYTERGWFVVMSKNPNYTAQTYKYTQTWPSDWIKEKYDQDYYITSVSCSTGKWLWVMSKVKNYTGQRYKQANTSELKEWYNEWRDKGYYLTQATYSSGKWLWVITSGTNIKNQGYKWATNSNLNSVVKEIWNGGDRIHLVEYADGDYFIPYGEYKGSQPPQSYSPTFNDLSDWISKNWNDGMAICYVGGGNPTSKSTSTASTTTSTTTTNPSSNSVARTYRQNVTQYGYEEVTEYANGGKVVAVYGACQACFGTTQCQMCHGYGGTVTAGYGTYIPCVYCDQSGKCPQCRYSNGIVLRASHMYDSNGREIYMPSGSYSASSGSSSYSSGHNHSSSGTCSKCGGSGINPTPNSGGSMQSWVAHYNSEGTKCFVCGRYSAHYHDKCSSCNVPRY